jgi:hypothetical protein
MLRFLRNFVSALFCEHPNARLVMTFYGDAINRNGCRELWYCPDCLRHVRRKTL